MKIKGLLFGLMGMAALSVSAAQPQIIAHRGNWKTPGATQNTIKAMYAADSVNCYGSEFDVWMTADKRMLVYHDENVYPSHRKVQYADYDEIKDIRLTNGDRIPLLEEYLDAAMGTKAKIIFELKPHLNEKNEREAVRRSVDMINERGLASRTEFITFSKNAMLEFIKLTDCPVYYLNGEMTPAELKEVGAAGADYNFWVLKKHPEWIKECHELGMKVNVWTVDKPEQIKWCIDNGVDFITTNVPSLAFDILNGKN